MEGPALIPTPLAGTAPDPRPPWKPLAGSAPLAWLMFLGALSAAALCLFAATAFYVSPAAGLLFVFIGANLLCETRQRAE